jgi:hypothetical protein
VIEIFVSAKVEIMVEIDKFVFVVVIFLSLFFIATNSNGKLLLTFSNFVF